MQSPPTPKAPAPAPLPTGPDVAQQQADERAKLAQRRGRMATIFAGSSGLSPSASTTQGTLLGQSSV